MGSRENIPVPRRMAHLPRDSRGYVVPKFVAVIDGVPDFRVSNGFHLKACVERGLCWLCGGRMGTYSAFVLGPMCMINRVNSEPPSHMECAEYAVKVCPFLSMPKAQRREANMPEDHKEASGVPIKRNPGVALLWVTKVWRAFNVENGDGNPGIMFDIGPPWQVSWYCEGRQATRAEVMESIEGGLPNLVALAEQDGGDAIDYLNGCVETAMKLVPQ